MDLMAIRRGLMAQSSKPQITMNGADYEWTNNYFLGQSNKPNPGVANSNTNFYKITLDFIPCSSLVGRTVQITGSNTSSVVLLICAFYSTNDETSCVGYTVEDTATGIVPNNAQYCRFCMAKNNSVNDFYLTTID